MCIVGQVCTQMVLRSSWIIQLDYLVAQKKFAEPLRQHGGPQYQDYAGLC